MPTSKDRRAKLRLQVDVREKLLKIIQEGPRPKMPTEMLQKLTAQWLDGLEGLKEDYEILYAGDPNPTLKRRIDQLAIDADGVRNLQRQLRSS